MSHNNCITRHIISNGNVSSRELLATVSGLSTTNAIFVGAVAGFTGSFTSAILNGASPGQALLAGIIGGTVAQARGESSKGHMTITIRRHTYAMLPIVKKEYNLLRKSCIEAGLRSYCLWAIKRKEKK